MNDEVKTLVQAALSVSEISEVPENAEPVFISSSPGIAELVAKVNLVARSQASVFISGESGTGKEVIARMIHSRSERADRPWIAVNCAALPKDVIDNELFGHEREAFTGAVSRKAGCFELAHGGTLFLDEIAEMHHQSQAKLLRAIEAKSFRRLGGKEEIKVDVRVIAATNREVAVALKTGELREDLYYRLSVVEIALPPLRERKNDIPALATHFLKMFSHKYGKQEMRLAGDCMDMLVAYDWPGNIREFKNLMESTVLVCPEQTIDPRHLPERITSYTRPSDYIRIPLGSSLEEGKRIVINATLASVGNNKSKAARILGLSRKALYDNLRANRERK